MLLLYFALLYFWTFVQCDLYYFSNEAVFIIWVRPNMGTKISILSKKVKTVHAHWTDSLLQLALACCPAALHTHRLRFYAAAAAPRTLCLPASLT